MKIGFIGLGAMGAAIAANLVRAKHEVRVWNRSAEKARPLIDAGAVPVMPPMDMFWGDRYGWVRDPFGHVWALCTVLEVLTAEEVEKRMAQFSKEAR